MEYFDLNLKPTELKHFGLQDGICSLIENAIHQCSSFSYWDEVSIKYDEANQTLQISDHGNGIYLKDFVQQLNYEKDGLTKGLRQVISSFLVNNVNIQFKSNFGTYTPIIHDKEGVSDQIPSIFIEYEPTKNKSSKWTNIKWFNHKENSDHGTLITIYPVATDTVKNTKYYLCFLQAWTKIIKTKVGYLMIGDHQLTNNVFLNGSNITYLSEEGDYNHHHFAFSYDTISALYDEDLIKKVSYNPWNVIDTFLIDIFNNLEDSDKEIIYAKLLNNHDCIEWDYQAVRKLIIQYYAKKNPAKYLLGIWNHEKQMFIDFAKEANKEIIWLKDNQELTDLINEGIATVYDFGMQYICDHYLDFVKESDLLGIEKNNWQSLQTFINYFIENYFKVNNTLKNLNPDLVDIKIVKKLPVSTGLYLKQQQSIIIDKSLLNDFAHLMSTIFNITANILASFIKWEDYQALWVIALTNFAIKEPQHKKNTN